MVKGLSVRICDIYTPRHVTPDVQREITAVAYSLFLSRGFQNGSPQEDWLRAKREVYLRRLGTERGRKRVPVKAAVMAGAC